MSAKLPPECLAVFRTVFYARLTETNRDLIHALTDVAVQVGKQDSHTIFALLADVEMEAHAACNLITAFSEYLEI